MKRLILSILAGFVVGAALSTAVDLVLHATGVYPPPGAPFVDTELLLLASAYRIVFQIFGAYVAAIVARDKAMQAVLIIGIVGAIIWLVGTFMNPELGPAWYGILGAALSIPSTLAGWKLYELRTRRLPKATETA